MLGHSAKFRLFCILIVLGAINLMLLSYFKRILYPYSAETFISTIHNASLLTKAAPVHTLFKSSALHINGTAVTHVQGVLRNSGRDANSSGAENVSRLGKLDGEGRVLQAWGKEVRPRAHVTPPWRQGHNSSTPCPLVPPNLAGRLQTYIQAPNWTEIVRLNPGLEPGGHYQPAQCRARHRVAVVIPYRDREEHLRVLLHNLHPMLIRQQLDYFILAVELAQPTKFNRAMLLNIGAVEAGGLRDVHCFVFHDVDLVPENDLNLYTCPDMPRHMSAAVDKFKYRLPYATIMGGVTAFSREHFYQVNGYSNVYFGWGGEDDDISTRVRHARLKISRYPMEIARYRMIRHGRDKNNAVNPMRMFMLKNVTGRQPTDGLNSLEYQVHKVEFRPTYTWILVSIDEAKIMKTVKKEVKEKKKGKEQANRRAG